MGLTRVRAMWRAKCAKADAQRYYDATAYHCAKVSKLNHGLAFEITRKGTFGGPVVSLVKRPETISVQEGENKVVVRDGVIWSIQKEMI